MVPVKYTVYMVGAGSVPFLAARLLLSPEPW